MLEMAGKSAALERWLADNEKKAVTGRSPACLCRTSLPINDLPCVVAFWVMKATDCSALRTPIEDLYARMLTLRTNLVCAQVTSTRTQLLCQQMYCPSKRWMARQKTWRWRIHCMRLKRPCRPAPLRLMCTSSRWAILLVKAFVSP